MGLSEIKKCKDCQEWFPINKFYRQSSGYYMSYCKECSKKRSVKWCREHLQQVVDRNRVRRHELHDENPEKYRERIRAKSTRQRIREKGMRIIDVPIEQRRAYDKVHKLKKKLLLTPPEKCPICGIKVKLIGHHPDYTKPDEVEWMCQRCHILKHHEERNNNVRTL